jgi:hypothetical protein
MKTRAFWKFFNTAPHRKKYSDMATDHPAVLCAEEAWDRAIEDAVIICNAVASQAYHQGKDHSVAKECARQIADILKDKSVVNAIGGTK